MNPIRRSRPRRDPHWQDRQVSVEELDNQYARERYRTLNKQLASGERADTTYETAPTRTPDYRASTYSTYDDPIEETTTYRSTSYRSTPDSRLIDDLDDENARQRYRAENRRLSGPDALENWWGWTAWYTDGSSIAVFLRKRIAGEQRTPTPNDPWF